MRDEVVCGGGRSGWSTSGAWIGAGGVKMVDHLGAGGAGVGRVVDHLGAGGAGVGRVVDHFGASGAGARRMVDHWGAGGTGVGRVVDQAGRGGVEGKAVSMPAIPEEGAARRGGRRATPCRGTAPRL